MNENPHLLLTTKLLSDAARCKRMVLTLKRKQDKNQNNPIVEAINYDGILSQFTSDINERVDIEHLFNNYVERAGAIETENALLQKQVVSKDKAAELLK